MHRSGLRLLLGKALFLLAASTAAQSTGQYPEDGSPIPVRAATLADIAIDVQRSVPATAVSLRSAVVASELSARVIELAPVPGDLLSSGQIIARLDCRDSELALASARSQLAALDARQSLARQQLGRLNQLKQSRSASEEQISQRAAELSIVTAEIATQTIAIDVAEHQVARCDIRAPFSGLVTKAPGQVGNYLSPGAPVVTLVDIDRVELKANLLETQVSELESSPARFAFGDKSWPLSVRTVFPVIDEATQTREIRFNFLNDKPPPGSIGRLQWELQGLTIPASFLVARDEGIGIFVIDDVDQGTVRFVAIDSARPGQPAAVDFAPDLLVVTEGRFGLRDGQEVIVE